MNPAPPAPPEVVGGLGDLPGITWLEHTADLGFQVRGASPAAVYCRAVAACAWLLFGDEARGRGRTLTLTLVGASRAERLRSLLEELLFRLEVEGFVVASADILEERERDGSLTVRLHGESFDPRRHRVVREIKAVTYHGLAFEPEPGGYVATLLLDL
ncbi:MAG: archease [Myxococcota bacterium]|nr:archease [Myxococcota bacterium]